MSHVPGDFEATLQQMTELKASSAEQRAQKDELTGENDALNSQIKVSTFYIQ